jgi:DNA-binding transcriptional ArsR family regulator
MGRSKNTLFNKKQNELAKLAKALGHPARIDILQHLIESETCINIDLVNKTGLAQPTISQHLKILQASSLIKATSSGNSVHYCIHPEGWQAMKSELGQFISQPSKTGICC